jgi:hypothetical protein
MLGALPKEVMRVDTMGVIAFMELMDVRCCCVAGGDRAATCVARSGADVHGSDRGLRCLETR